MSFKVQVGPPQISIHQGHTVLVSEPDGQINWPSDRGLYFFDTRLISAWAVYANGEPWDLLNGGAVTYDSARVFLTNRSFLTEDGPVPAHSLGFALSRAIGGGLHEDLDISNYGRKPVRFNLEIAYRSDFADIFEVKSGKIVRRGRIETHWSEAEQRLRTVYHNQDFVRAVTVTTHCAPSPVYANGRLTFEVRLAPGESWHSCLLYDLANGDKHYLAPRECSHHARQSHHARGIEEWRQRVLKLYTSNEDFYHFYHQAIEDMAALRLPTEGSDHMVFIPAAGLPWFVALFGRDSLIVSLQNMLVYPEFARGAIDVLGRLQATERDDYRDAEPGKILHELRYGELAHFKLIPHTPYYGTADATPLYLIVLHSAWRATGDHSLIDRYLPNAEAALSWIDNWGDRDGDGFQEYQTRSPAGYENMAWKDAGDSMTYLDGTPVKGPKALCELQGYVYDAWLRMAEIYDELGNADRAGELRAKAQKLFERFNDAFWDEGSGFYAYMLDGEKRPVWTVASNPGHLLFSGIVPEDRAERVVARLMAPDMNSGWGIRTLSADHPAFNPYSYQNGSVWPHDNGIIAEGFKRYGFAQEAAQIAHDISLAAGFFLMDQVPELYSGVQRARDAFPVQYLGANVPQAWAAGSAFMLVQSLLGIQPDAPRGRLFVDPWLPDWLPDITLQDLRLGKKTFDVRFWRDGETTRWEVLRGDASAVEARSSVEFLQRLRHGKTA
ncbi:MAG TPA: glycogen debranching N-terminal domain-containing protein [Acetobacteraceae bacterium]